MYNNAIHLSTFGLQQAKVKRKMGSLRNHFKLLCQSGTLKQVCQIHAQVVTLGLIAHVQPLSCKILNMYAKLGQTTYAQFVFFQIPNPDLVSMTSMMTLLIQANKPHQAISIFYQLIFSNIKVDGFAIVGALSASGHIKNLALGKSLHGMIYRYELGNEVVVNNTLIDMYCRNMKLEMARKVFDKTKKRDAISWSTMLYGYTKCMGLDWAQNIFDQMPCKETGCWTVMITGYVQGGRPLQALKVFYKMTSVAHRPNLITIVGILSACADVGAADLGQLIHGYICKTGGNQDITVCNALIDMYSKSGHLQLANDIFRSFISTDIYTWTTMISGFAAHGDGKNAIKCFSDMLRLGVNPNEVTFLSVLLACNHSGLVHEGKQWFDIMRKGYNLKPSIEHYGCMVDLLSRAGLLREAQKLIEDMGIINPDLVIWRSLLSASLVHGNYKLAEKSGNEILKLEPEDDGVYVLLWNMYARSERWNDAMEMRKIMRNRKVVKKPGCSWIEVNGIIHEFLVEDKSHFLWSEIDVVLKGMDKQLKRSIAVSVY